MGSRSRRIGTRRLTITVALVLAAFATGCGTESETTDVSASSSTSPQGPRPVITGGGVSFGECLGLCVGEFRVDGSAVVLDRRSWDRTQEVASHGELTAEGRRRLDAIEVALVGVALGETYGCPDCADGGAAWVDLIVDGEGARSTYEYGRPPSPLAEWDLFATDLIIALAECTSGPLLEVAAGCQTEPAEGGPTIVGGGFSFGMCLGYCLTDLELAGADVLLTRSAWPGLDEEELEPVVVEGALTGEGEAALADAARGLVGVVLRDTYGCPDCADGGSGWVIVRDAAGQRRSKFEYFNPPPELATVDELLRGVIDALRTCTSNVVVTVEAACVVVE